MRVIVFAGLPGTGKSTLAEVIGTHFKIPVFALDWLFGSLRPFSILTQENATEIGMALLTTLVQRQCKLNQSAIIDSPNHTKTLRDHWKTLATAHTAALYQIETICSDAQLHRQHIEKRQQNIPGWHEVTWQHVERMQALYELWNDKHLVIDSARPLQENIQYTITYIQNPARND